MIYRVWRTRASTQFRDIFHDIHENDASTHWLTNDILQVLSSYWDSPQFKAKYVKGRVSKGSAKGGSLHLEAPLPLRAHS